MSRAEEIIRVIESGDVVAPEVAHDLIRELGGDPVHVQNGYPAYQLLYIICLYMRKGEKDDQEKSRATASIGTKRTRASRVPTVGPDIQSGGGGSDPYSGR